MKKKNLSKRFLKQVSFISFGLLFVAILLWQYDQNKSVSLLYLDEHGKEHILAISVKDRERLTGLMQKLFAEDSFAYTILGSKPLCWTNFQNCLPVNSWTNFYDSFSEHNRTLRLGWQTWEKYRHLFPSAHLWIENPPCYPGSTSILIVNKERFNEVVCKNKNDFEKVLCRPITDGFQLINEAQNRSLMNEVLEGHQALLGIVLGYGRNNSWQFHEGCINRKPIGWAWGEDDNYFVVKSLEPNTPLIDYYLSQISCPSFSGDAYSEESLELRSAYLLTRQKVLDYYKGKDFLEATLSLLAGHQ